MPRVTIQPVSITSLSSGVFAAGTGPGCDATATGTAFATWSSLGSPLGVQWVNNGYSFLVVMNGATSTTANVLVGRKGGAGQLPAYSAETVSIPASTALPLWLGPYSVQDFTQNDSTQYSGAPGGAIGTAGVGMTCVDFANTTTLSLRLYQLIPALP